MKISLVNKVFKLNESNTTLKKEILAGVVTFLTMAYIAFVNPIILSTGGMDKELAFTATCLVIFISCLMIAFIVNLPIAIGPGMGLNAIFVFDIIESQHYNYRIALLTVFLGGLSTLIVFLLVPAKLLVKALPGSLKSGITAGAGMFLILIGLHLSNIIIANPNTLLHLGNVSSIPFIFTILLFLVAFAGYNRSFYYTPIIIFIIAIIIELVTNNISLESLTFFSMNSYNLSIFTPHFSNWHWPLLGVIITLFFAGNFDSIGTFTSYHQLVSPNKAIQENILKRVMLVKGISSMLAGLLGTSTMTLFLESNTGVKSGGRTGLVALVVGILFLATLLLKPLLSIIPTWASSPILLTVGIFMLLEIKNLNWSDYTEYLPALLIFLFIPLTYSITNGIAIGLISYIIIKVLGGRIKEIHWIPLTLAVLFAVYLVM